MKQNNSSQKERDYNRKKKIIIGATIILLPVAFFAGRSIAKWIEKRNEADIQDFAQDVENGTTPQLPVVDREVRPSPSSYTKTVYHPPKYVNELFPLKRGSKGDLVKDVQQALMKKYGDGILPKYGDDGYYGKEMETALVRKGYPTTIDSKDYSKIVLKDSKTDTPKDDDKDTSKPSVDDSKKFNPKAIAYSLYKSVKNDDVIRALEVLKKIKNKDQYLYVNEEFKKKDIVGSTSMTIATALDFRFGKSKEYKKKINSQLYRIGLKYDGEKWSLSGFLDSSNLVCTITPTTIWDKRGKQLSVHAKKILGSYIRSKNGICEFETENGKLLFVNAHQISYVS